MPGAPEPLVSAVTRCLAKNPATRWTDAGSLRRALVASESEAPEPESEVSVLRVGVLCLVTALPVRAYTALFHAAAPDWDAVVGVEAARALGALGAFLIAVAVLTLRHRKRMPWRAMLAAALQQPSWWGTWYPRTFRRPGDVWHRLPRRIRRFNNGVGLTAVVFLFVSMPLPILVVSAQGYEARTGRPSSLGAQLERATASRAGQVVLGGLFFLPFVALAGLTAEAMLYRRHLVRTLGAGLPDPELATQALHTPSWKRSFWDKPPIGLLLLPEDRPPARRTGEHRGAPVPGMPGAESETMTRPADSPPRVD